MTVQSVVENLQFYIQLVLGLIAGVAALLALASAAITRPDAYTAVDAQSKTFWVALLGVSTLVIWLYVWVGMGVLMLFLIGVVAVMVYIVDVRRRLDGVLNRNWFRKLG